MDREARYVLAPCHVTDEPNVVICKAFVEGKPGRSQAPGADRARPLLRAGVRGVSVTNHLEPLERVHVCVQGIGADSPIRGDGKAERVPLARGPDSTSRSNW